MFKKLAQSTALALRERDRTGLDVRGFLSSVAGHAVSRLSKSTTQARTEHELPFGVNVAGYFASEKGLGEAVRADVRCLRAARVPFVQNNYDDQHGSLNLAAGGDEFREDSPYRFNLIHINPDQLHVFAGRKEADYFSKRYTIGFWVWELDRFPKRFHGGFKYVDEVWVPSSFAQDAISRVSPVPVVRFPHAMQRLTSELEPWERRELGVPEDAFVFLFMLDFYSVVERKNPLALIRAFRRAFPENGRAWLVLKCSHPEHEPAALAQLKREAEGLNVKFMDRILTRAQVNGLLKASDAYVSLHRSEGFGLTLAEAMMLGKPVIATDFSGNRDFMTHSNSFPVRCSVHSLERDFGPYEQGALWADPDIDDAARAMGRVFSGGAEVDVIVRQGRKDAETQLSAITVGALMSERLNTIDETLRARQRRLFVDASEARRV